MKVAWTKQIAWLAIGAGAFLSLALRAQAQSAEEFFEKNCVACHTIGRGRLIGPDLQGVTKRKDRAWLVKFMQSPQAMIDSKDPYAMQLLQDAHGVPMPTLPGMTADMANSLLDFVEGKAGSTQTAAAGPVVSERAFTDADVAAGRQIFTGGQALANGGPACVSCHSLGTIGGFGGGRLGPDLTQVLVRLGGRNGLGAWLSNPPTPTMQSVFGKHALQPDEIFSLLAGFDDAGKNSQPAASSMTWKFFLFGFVGMLVGLALIQLAWRGRFRAVRHVMVHGQIRGGK